jgi:uncharacterized protein (TIGR01777 family)
LACVFLTCLLNQGMVIGITGASGFIGKALARAARERGHRVVAFTRRKNGGLPDFDETRVIVPTGDKPALDPSGLDALIHLAGETVYGYWTAAKKKRIRDSRVDLTRRVVDAMQNCKGDGPRVFLCASGTGAYGDRGDEILTETSKRGWGFLADVCAEWEREAARATTFGVRVVHLRTGMVLGQGGGAWPVLRRIFSLRLGSRLGDGRQWVPWIHIDDEVGIILETVENLGYSGPVNLASPNPVTNAEMTRTIANLLNTSTFIPVPGFALKLVMGEFGSIALESARVKPEVALTNGYEFKYTDLEHALAMCV